MKFFIERLHVGKFDRNIAQKWIRHGLTAPRHRAGSPPKGAGRLLSFNPSVGHKSPGRAPSAIA